MKTITLFAANYPAVGVLPVNGLLYPYVKISSADRSHPPNSILILVAGIHAIVLKVPDIAVTLPTGRCKQIAGRWPPAADLSNQNYQTQPCSRMAFTTHLNPAILAPAT